MWSFLLPRRCCCYTIPDSVCLCQRDILAVSQGHNASTRWVSMRSTDVECSEQRGMTSVQAHRFVQGWASLWNLNAKSSSSVEVMQRSSSFLAGWGTIRDSNWFKYLHNDTVNFFSAPFSQLVGAIISMLIALIILVNLTNLSYNRISQHHAIQWKPKSGNWHKRSCHVSRGWLASTGGNVISHWSIAWHQRDGEGTGCFRRWRSGTQVPSRWEIGNPVLC